ncbi:hybrid sensor histidine kinase/response regulator [Candidatus Leptofilum sp.]|uniref:hybrid sensor histidine kinase/response regulator n=1 Tax=Candidatus Leptofilum sp. TaxID=3241576 RepID=UPI003B58EAD3
MLQNSSVQSHICVVDDNPMAREVIAEQLSIEPYRVTLVASGLQLLEQLETIQPDVILMDVMMPQLSGYDVCHQIKQNPNYQHIPIILVTALNSREDMLQGLNAGADEFLSKPVNGSELRARVRTMLRIKNQYDALQAIMQLREDLAHMLIHDMRNPLTVATLYNNFLLKRNRLEPRDKEYATLVHNSLVNLAGFLDEILTVAKMEEGKLQLLRASYDLNQLIKEVAQNHADITQVNEVTLHLDLPTQPQLAFIDSTLFKRVIDNLLSNALKYAPEGSQVTIRLCKNELSEQSFCLQIVDEGPGIAPENYGRIFDRYEVVSLKKSGQEQVGLGLAFCKMVVEAHDGRISVSPNTPTGAIFTVHI